MGGQMWHLFEAQAEALGEEAEFRRFRAIVEGFSTTLGEEANVEVIKQKFDEIMAPKSKSIGLLTRKELEMRWRVSKHIIKRYEGMGMPVALRVGGRPRYEWEGVEKWREEVLLEERANEVGIGGSRSEIRRTVSERLVSRGGPRMGKPSLPRPKPRPDLLSSYESSRLALRQHSSVGTLGASGLEK